MNIVKPVEATGNDLAADGQYHGKVTGNVCTFRAKSKDGSQEIWTYTCTSDKTVLGKDIPARVTVADGVATVNIPLARGRV